MKYPIKVATPRKTPKKVTIEEPSPEKTEELYITPNTISAKGADNLQLNEELQSKEREGEIASQKENIVAEEELHGDAVKETLKISLSQHKKTLQKHLRNHQMNLLRSHTVQ